MLQRLAKSKSKTFLTFCFSFLLGVAGMSLWDRRIEFVYFYFIAFICVAFLVVDWKNPKLRFCFLTLLFLTFGAFRYAIAFPVDSPQNITHYGGQELELTGYISDEPDIRTDGVRYIVTMLNSKFKMQNDDVRGKLYLKSDLYPRYQYGDIVQAHCRLEEPAPILDKQTGRIFHYDKYLATFGAFMTCQSSSIRIIEHGAGNVFYRHIFLFKQKVAEQISRLWHEPYASFMAGLLYGYRGGLGRLNDDFNRAGVSHIVAVSGFNIAIIVSVVSKIFPYFRVPRQKAFWAITAGLIAFVIFTGAGASVVRAALLGWLVILGPQLGRVSRPAYLLIPTATLMAFHNPYILLWDIGFQLSFLSTLGILYFSPILEAWAEKLPEWFGIKQSAISTISAIIATLPLILFQFGRLSIVAPIVNVLILWIIPWLMLFGAISAVAGFISTVISAPLAWMAWLGMEYVARVVVFFARLPWASVYFSLPWYSMILMYGGLLLYVYRTQIQRIKRITTDQFKSV